MKKIFIYFSFLILLIFPVITRAEVIRGYDSQITIQKDGTILVREKIDYDFEYLYKHGIYRKIPFVKKNSEGKEFEMTIRVQGITDEKGTSYSHSDSLIDKKLNIKIGDANRTITGIHTYTITYLVSGALTYFSETVATTH